MKKLSAVIAAVIALALTLCACGSDAGDGKKNNKSEDKEVHATAVPKKDNDPDADKDKEAHSTAAPKDEDISELTENVIDAVITLTNGETVRLELYPDVAPKTVANFIKNVQEGYYTGTIFHRAIEGFMVQGGGYDADLNLKEQSETVEGEFEDNGFDNKLKHTRGVISMARVDNNMDSATTQFFIMQEDAPHLDGSYAAFGKVTEGMDLIDEIAEAPKVKDAPAVFKDMPAETYEIASIEIENE